MRVHRSGAVVLVALLLCLLHSEYSRAQPSTAPSTSPTTAPAAIISKDTGAISGTVLTVESKPAADLNLRLIQDVPMGMGAGGGGGGGGGSGGGRPGEKLVARVTTDKDGKFVFPNLEPGAYRIIAGNNEIGWIYYDVEVQAEKEEKLDIKLVKIR